MNDEPGTDRPTRSNRTLRSLPSRFSPLRLIATILLAVLVVGLIAVVAGWRPSLNPFKERTIDRSSPAVLRSLEDLSSYHAAGAHFEVVVDLEDDTRWIPAALKGERTLFVGVGTVDSTVDFGHLDADAVTVSPDRRSVTIELPNPTLSTPVLDLDHSYVVARQRGALDRVGGLLGGVSSDKGLYQKASSKMTDAARTDGQVIELGKKNTTAMLRGLLGALGFTDVRVTYAADRR
ncbi:Protein of unknown function (DUF4230) [Frankia torreyi]|uniref:DUF4230 domain-containing protein n=1 Tax=Frankia torreyi TaxID=1856 RepID=A0A0D8BMS4_9ACTN|nr:MULTISPECIES: DUF4230 domain-containing protein [Frankia]KJE25456.1 Protein of unknown function (DUF4230) [Frankia torreyi]KQC38569.1 hypothetical protein UK82_09050 [Frankia sp. ACN1ag]KQM04816.1 Protein of unknown function (DUF4230) [Frankia sp. CpI1-P]